MGNTTKRICKVNTNTILDIIGMGSVLENEVIDEVKHDKICKQQQAIQQQSIISHSLIPSY